VIVGVMGQARSGKDTMATHLVQNYDFVRIGLADPLKRFCKEVFDFSDEQLYGDDRDKPDSRYWKYHGSMFTEEDNRTLASLDYAAGKIDKMPDESEFSKWYLTPRYALQTLGTEWGRRCHDSIWVDYGIRVAQKLLAGYYSYSSQLGLLPDVYGRKVLGVVFSDLRFQNEFEAVKKANGFMVRVYRKGAEGEVGISGHASEVEQKAIPDANFDHIFKNDGTLEEYYAAIDRFMTGTLQKAAAG
jgi:hypothetical protein